MSKNIQKRKVTIILEMLENILRLRDIERDPEMRALYDTIGEELVVLHSKLSGKKTCLITGAEEANGFIMEVPEEKIEKVAKDIFDNPQYYSKYYGEGKYEVTDETVSYLWVEYPDKTEKKLLDIIYGEF